MPDKIGQNVDDALASIYWLWLPLAVLLLIATGYGLWRLVHWLAG